MAEEEAGGRGISETFKHKLGPLPVGVWVIAAVVVWYVVSRRKSSSAGGQQTDPAGNTGTIDPKTGYVYGTSQDQSALGAQDSGNLGTSSGSGSTVAGQYTTNADWARAAINLLVGQGIDPTEANTAIEQYIGSQQLSPQQQADVNLAIQSLGAPPDPPQPGGNPTPIVTPPSPGPVYATNPPTGLMVSGTTTSTVSATWNRSTNATGYTMTVTASGQPTASTTVTGTDAGGTVSGLAPQTDYQLQVQATPARPGDGYASTGFTTAAQSASPAPEPAPAPAPAPAPVPAPPRTTTVTVAKFGNPAPWNSTMWGIANHFGISLSKLEAANPQVTNPNLIYPGQQITVPLS